MNHRKRFPAALTIAGSDSGGGAGIQADLKTFAALGVHGACAVTCVTAQNPTGVFGVQPCRPDLVAKQIEAVISEFKPAAIKTGMLYSSAIIRSVTGILNTLQNVPLIVDPVMIATSGAELLRPQAKSELQNRLFPLATLIAPNVDEAQVLCGICIKNPEDLRRAARNLHTRFQCAVLVKGGHLSGLKEAIDILYDGEAELLLSAPFVRGVVTHGTGCTFSAAIAAHLALGNDLYRSVERAKQFVSESIAGSVSVARHTVLNHGGRN